MKGGHYQYSYALHYKHKPVLGLFLIFLKIKKYMADITDGHL